MSAVEETKQQEKPKSFARRDTLLDIENEMQKKWDELKPFEIDAPAQYTAEDREKFFVTFPYPYMNGVLHLGHAFSLTKSEFAAGYQRLKGKNALFPFSFHCTGMPIAAAAQKLKRELETYGNPPDYSKVAEEEEEETTTDAAAEQAQESSGPVDPTKFKSKKGKAKAKTGGIVSQYKILKDMGVPAEEIEKFTDPVHWLRYFPPIAQKDLKRFGLHTDWRRSFITTDVNPYYDSFIRWQFETLRKKDKIQFGKRYAVFSPMDDQPCADHDRATGEGVGPQEYTIIKMQVQSPLPQVIAERLGAAAENKRVYLAAATLRPETMYGQTNCWVAPTEEEWYGAFEINDDEIFIMTERAALNLAYQGHSKVHGKLNRLATFNGMDLIGTPLRAPNAIKYDTIYVLPMLNVSNKKGTGIVTSVPSDAPDDYAALADLKSKPKLREKFGVKDEWVLPFEPVPIIDIPGFGNLAAIKACEDMKVKSQNDRELLEKAKAEVYLKGFYEGKMIVGPYAGEKVNSVKAAIKEQMIKNGDAILYSEPEKQVISRSGDECVVALVDQWFLRYGEEEWKKQVAEHLKTLETFNPSTHRSLEETVEWLKEWACSRTFGLGTRLPWDESVLIDSLSDSTIYMAFYTFAHLLQGNSLDGSAGSPLGIKPEQLTYRVWDYILLGAAYPADEPNVPPEETLKKLRHEFNYWYPVDLRVSGKDLIGNHLPMFLYNHAAIFPPELWPRSIYTNGHIMINEQKMSKSTGNFLTIADAIKEYSADAVRLALCDAGDSLDDANFKKETANMAILRFTTHIEYIKELLSSIDSLRTGPADTFADRVFENKIHKLIAETDEWYQKMVYRSVLRCAFFDMNNAFLNYRTEVGKAPLHRDLVLWFLEVQAIVMSPITPHLSEYIWQLLGKQGTIMHARFPEAKPVDRQLLAEHAFLQNTIHTFRTKIQKDMENKAKKSGVKLADMAPPTTGHIYVADSYLDWQQKTVEVVRKLFRENGNQFPQDAAKALSAVPELKKEMKKVMPFVAMLKQEVQDQGPAALEQELTINEKEILDSNMEFVVSQLAPLTKVEVYKTTDASAPDPQNKMQLAMPGRPSFAIFY